MHGLAIDPRGFDAINDYDWRDWLRLHGASEQSLDSGFLRGLYDLAFAYEDGDVSRPRLAAGVALRGADADVLHLSRRALLADERGHGRRRVRAAVRGAQGRAACGSSSSIGSRT